MPRSQNARPDEKRHDAMANFRPRFSLQTALLLMTIVGMAIVIAQLWREVGPLRAEVKQLRNETGRLYVEDKSKLCAIQVDTKDELSWKWRVWIPENRTFAVNVTAESVPKKGFPQQNRGTIWLSQPGEQIIEYHIQRDPRDGQWYGSLQGGSGSVGKDLQPWVNWPSRSSESQGVGRRTGVAKPGEPFVLMRSRVSQAKSSTQIEDPAAGFMIWMEPAR